MTATKRISNTSNGTNSTRRSSSQQTVRAHSRTVRSSTFVSAGSINPRQSEIDFIRGQGQKLAAMKTK